MGKIDQPIRKTNYLIILFHRTIEHCCNYTYMGQELQHSFFYNSNRVNPANYYEKQIPAIMAYRGTKYGTSVVDRKEK